MNRITTGYRKDFLGKDHQVSFPVLNAKQKKDLARYKGRNYVLDYLHYSVVMSKSRRFAYFTAVNIDGTTWRDNPRKGRWKKDKRIKEQFGNELYAAAKSNFDKGHLVRREDPEWGDSSLALEAGKNTFWYTNCVPQHKNLNREIWDELESNILHKGANGQQLKISVFTGPALSENDGVFVTKVNDLEVKMPNLFWKVVTWLKTDGRLYAVGFIQSQEKFLIEDGVIKKLFVPKRNRLRKLVDEDIFEHLKFKDGKTYQVSIGEIEKTSGLKFHWPGAIKPYEKPSPARIRAGPVMKRNRPFKRSSGFIPRKMRLNLSGLVLGF